MSLHVMISISDIQYIERNLSKLWYKEYGTG